MVARKKFEQDLIERALKDADFRKALLENPRKVLAEEYYLEVPEDFKLNIVEEKSNEFTLVIPASEATAEELNAEELDAIAGGTNGSGTLACWGNNPDNSYYQNNNGNKTFVQC